MGVSSSQTLYCNNARGAKCTGELGVCVRGGGGTIMLAVNEGPTLREASGMVDHKMN